MLKAYRPQLKLETNLPQAEEPDLYVPTSEEVKAVLEAASERLRVPVLLASSGSLRREEICALTPEDITDFGVRVNKAVVYDYDKNLVVKLPKSQAGDRFCPLPPEIIQEVRVWSDFGISPNALNGVWQKLKYKLGLEFRFHDFRHYFASELHAQGVPDQYIMKVGGWKSAATLQRIYRHTLRDKEKIYNVEIVNIFTAELIASKKRQKRSKKVIYLTS